MRGYSGLRGASEGRLWQADLVLSSIRWTTDEAAAEFDVLFDSLDQKTELSVGKFRSDRDNRESPADYS